jgi:hypothetical protein
MRVVRNWAKIAWLAFFASCAFSVSADSFPSLDEWMDATIRLNDGRGNNSSAILLEKNSTESPREVFVVLNKHFLVGEDPANDAPTTVTMFLNTANNGELAGQPVVLDMYLAEAPAFRFHPDPSVDVMAIDASVFFRNHPEIANRPIAFERIDGREEAFEPQVADDVFIVGYPLEMAHARAYAPIVRRAMIANRPSQRPMIDARFPSGELDQFELRGFLIDGFILPGSSGAPVLLVNSHARAPNNGREGLPFLGIVSRTSFTRIRLGGRDLPVLSGIGIVFESATVFETLDAFGLP